MYRRMNNILKNFILAIFALGIFIVPGTNLQAASPTIISAEAFPEKSEVALEGVINPNGYLTTAWFEYGTSKTLSSFEETIHVAIGEQASMTPISGVITNLVPNTDYYFRLVADNGQRTIKGNIIPFTTKEAPLEVATPVVNNVSPKINLGANPIDSEKNFLPSTLIDWLVLVLVIMCIVVVGRLMYRDTSTVSPKNL